MFINGPFRFSGFFSFRIAWCVISHQLPRVFLPSTANSRTPTGWPGNQPNAREPNVPKNIVPWVTKDPEFYNLRVFLTKRVVTRVSWESTRAPDPTFENVFTKVLKMQMWRLKVPAVSLSLLSLSLSLHTRTDSCLSLVPSCVLVSLLLRCFGTKVSRNLRKKRRVHM